MSNKHFIIDNHFYCNFPKWFKDLKKFHILQNEIINAISNTKRHIFPFYENQIRKLKEFIYYFANSEKKKQ